MTEHLPATRKRQDDISSGQLARERDDIRAARRTRL